MARATRPEKTCKGCPEKRRKYAQAHNPQKMVLTFQGEGERLWKHVLVGTGTCIGMIEAYASLKVPGDPKDGIVSLRNRLNKVISKLEQNNEDHGERAPEQQLSASPDDRHESQGDLVNGHGHQPQDVRDRDSEGRFGE